MSFAAPGLLRTVTAPAWLETARRTHRLVIALRLRSLAEDQRDPATILTISKDSWVRNLALDQEGDDLELWLRARRADGGRRHRDDEVRLRLPDVFVDRRWVDVAIEVAPGEAVLRVDDREKRRQLDAEPLARWNGSYLLSLGNEVSGAHPWIGEIEGLVVRTPGTSQDYPDSAILEEPSRFWILNHEIKPPFHEVSRRDAFNNLLLYIPVGVLLGLLWRRGGWRAAAGAVLVVAGLSAAMEFGQLFIATRYPSMTDTILNAAGGGLGFVACRVVRQLAGPRWLWARLRRANPDARSGMT